MTGIAKDEDEEVLVRDCGQYCRLSRLEANGSSRSSSHGHVLIDGQSASRGRSGPKAQAVQLVVSSMFMITTSSFDVIFFCISRPSERS
jgi:hypothetical protein